MATPPTQTSKGTDTLTAILLFVINFALWQAYWQLLEITAPAYPYDILLFLAFPIASLAVYAALIILRRTTFRRNGFRKPANIKTKTTIILSIACAIFYIVMLLAPGLTAVLSTGNVSEGFEFTHYFSTPLGTLYRIGLGMVYAVISSLAFEAVFRGYVFRNLVRHHGFFKSLYASAIMFSLISAISKNSISSLLTMDTSSLVEFLFMDVLTAFAAGLFLGYYFYKTGWSLLGPVIFQMGIGFFLWPSPFISSTSLWWMALTFQVIGYAVLILAIDTFVKEPMYVRKRYGLES
jgi:membrane protease YdiL (CAAX protease family)